MKNKPVNLLMTLMVMASLAAAVFAFQTEARLRFAKGASSATVSGAVGNYGKREYIVGAKKGQSLNASVKSGCESVKLDVLYRETGESLTDASATSFANTLPTTGDYIIRVETGDLPSCKFTLKVAIN